MPPACRAPGPAGGAGLGSSTAVKHSPPKGVEAPAIAAPERAVKFPPSTVADPAFVPKPVEGLMNTPGLNGLTAGGISGLQTVRSQAPRATPTSCTSHLRLLGAAQKYPSGFCLQCSHGGNCPSRRGSSPSISMSAGLCGPATCAQWQLCGLTSLVAWTGLFPGGGGAARQLHNQRGRRPAGPRQSGQQPVDVIVSSELLNVSHWCS
jgi:hypothetical protein